jgi:hypothetical protein
VSTFRTEIEFDKKYRDKNTGFEGTATQMYFYQHGCERVLLKGMNTQGEIVEYVFDAPELEDAATKRGIKLLDRKTGGPHDSAAPRGAHR